MAGRQRNLGIHYNRIHPVILYTKHVIARTVIRTQHVHLLHTGPLLVADSLSRRYHLNWRMKRNLLSYSRLYHMLEKVCTYPTTSDASTSFTAQHSRLCIETCWSRLCWSDVCQTWLCSQTCCYQSLYVTAHEKGDHLPQFTVFTFLHP